MRVIILIILINVCACNAYSQKEFVIEGKTEGFADSTWLDLRNNELESIADSVQVFNNRFSFSGEVDEPSNYAITTRFSRDPASRQYKFLWLEPGKITLEGKYGEFRYAKVEGSKTQKQQDKLTDLKKNNEIRYDSLVNEFQKGDLFADSTLKAKAMQIQASLRQESNDISNQFIKDNPGYLISAVELSYLMKSIDKDQAQSPYENLSPEIKSTKYGLAIDNFLKLNRSFKTGDTYVDINLPNSHNTPISLSDFKGKYVLLDFWASGCGPCRMEHPKLLELYNKYKDQGFEIYAVSLDKNRNNWLKAIEKDQIIWPNVSDLQGFNSQVALTYGVYYVPNNYLIDPDGIIIEKDLRGQSLEKRIEEIFSKN
ncbi:MAG: redoxin domain-containing protein, partial [Cyclobacteriaceae bacterium]